MDLRKLNLSQGAEGLRAKRFSARELVQCFLAEIESKKELNAFVSLTPEAAFSSAEAVDRKIAAGEKIGPLAGLPCALKDVFCQQGELTTAASRILSGYRPPFDAVAVERLKAADAVFLGKTNTDEFTCGASTENSCYGVTKNPVDPTRVAGGSSGGSAAAVAADLCIYSLGTDTGGSIRQPAAFCGVPGLKVTYGLVPRTGVISMASSWDTIGPLAKTVADLARVLQVIAGADERDSTTPKVPVPDYLAEIEKPLKGLKVGVAREFFAEGLETEIETVTREALKNLEKLGASLVDISIPTVPYAVSCYYVLTPAEVSANMSRYDGIRFGKALQPEPDDLEAHYYRFRGEGFGEEMKRRILIGTYVLSAGYYNAYYRKAQQVRSLIIDDFNKAFAACDVIAAPVSPTPAFRIGEKAGDPLALYLADVCTIPASAAGIPALSVPCGFTALGLPVGLQLMAPQFAEASLLNVGHVFERELKGEV